MRSMLCLLMLFIAPGCDRGQLRVPAATAAVVDSAIPREEALRRFRIGLDSVAAFDGGASSREALVRQYIAALGEADTAAIKRLTLTKAEFAWLYYPESAQGRPPYDLSPSLMWFMMDEQSRKGLSRALTERGGRPYAYAGFTCDGEGVVEGPNTLWGPCQVLRVAAPEDTIPERLFGQIIGRGGLYKFTTHANKF